MLKLCLEITADNGEEMIKAIDEIKKDYKLGAVFLSRKNYDGYNYKCKLVEEN